VTRDPLNGQTVLVIGGSAGIGLEIARQVSQRGASLVIIGRDHAKLGAAAERLNGPVKTVALDAHDESALEQGLSRLDAVDHVVSMIGDSMAGGFMTTAPETMRHVLHSKFWTNWMIARHAAPLIREGGSLTFTSGTGARAHEISASYVANLGLGALVEGLAVELAPRVRVNAVALTFMGSGTAFWRDIAAEELLNAESAFVQTVPLRRLATPKQVASTYVHVMTSGFITGQMLAVDGGVMLAK
jgi:NAD(P)-dependent dehydrogenase (short-subunit alcohol dehydrogenase family)